MASISLGTKFWRQLEYCIIVFVAAAWRNKDEYIIPSQKLACT